MPDLPTLSVVLVNWNRREATLTALERLAVWRRLRPRVWVVDNGSTDGSAAAIAERFPGCRLIASPVNQGYGHGNNRALREIPEGYVLLLNNDAAIGEESVERLVRALDGDPGLAAVGPVLSDADHPEEIVAAGGRDISRHVATHLGPADLPAGWMDGERPLPVAYVPGTAVLLRVAALLRVGLLEEGYFFGGELADLCERLRRAGYRSAVVPGARAVHDAAEAGELRRDLYPYYILRNRFLFVRKFRRRRLHLYLLWTAYGLVSAARDALRGDRRRLRLHAAAVADGLRGRFGGRNELRGG